MVGAPHGDRVADLFHLAVALAPGEREQFVRDRAGQDEPLANEVLLLLAEDCAETQTSLRSPMPQVVAAGLHGDEGESVLEGADGLTSIGPYRLLGELGEGGMGRVYRAEQLEPIRRTVALKVMRRWKDSASARARFRAEQQVLVRLQHRGIARVVDGGVTPDGRPYLAMDLVDGQPLHEWLASEQPSLQVRLDLFHALCEAVQHAHLKGVIHRDLKPSNVLVTMTEHGPEPRVIDFGIARVLETDAGEETLHTVGDVAMGTAGYMSPEQAVDAASADARSDVYALAVILYEMLTGTLPRGRVTVADSKAWQTTPERPSRRPANHMAFAHDLDWVVLQGLAAEPDRRYSTVVEFAADIARARRFEPVTARPPKWSYLLVRFLRRNRVAAAVAGSGLLALVVASLALLSLWNEADRNWNDYRRLVDDKRLLDLRTQARDELWPPWPSTIAAIDNWLLAVAALAERRSDIEQRAAVLHEQLADTEPGAHREELSYQQEVLQRLVSGLAAMFAAEPSEDNVAGVRLRRLEAQRVAARSLDEAAEQWRVAIDSIADPAQCPAYRELRLPGPQAGLVPLGHNHTTGLWEFWHVESGEAPAVRRNEVGQYLGAEIAENSGMVFVLVPGGRFTIGALRVGDEHSGSAPIDPQAAPMEQHVHDIVLAPFFVSAFEVTQGQWLRLTGVRPSFTVGPRTSRGHLPDLRHPVEQVTWREAVEALRRRGCKLPTEAQWEYCARAGTATVFGGVADAKDLPLYANLADAGSHGSLGVALEPDYDDGFAMTAPVGTFRANPWGLYDCHGNVAEWCRDWLVSYVQRELADDGYRAPMAGDEPTLRIMRGGDFAERMKLSRVASRNASPPEQRTARLGVRPVRAIRQD